MSELSVVHGESFMDYSMTETFPYRFLSKAPFD